MYWIGSAFRFFRDIAFLASGQAVFLAAVTVVGTLRDHLLAGQALGFIALSPGPLTVLVDAVCWAGTTALAQAAMHLVAGPAGADPLARRGRLSSDLR